MAHRALTFLTTAPSSGQAASTTQSGEIKTELQQQHHQQQQQQQPQQQQHPNNSHFTPERGASNEEAVFLLLERLPLFLGGETPEEGVVFDTVFPKAFAFVFRLEEKLDGFFVIAAVVVVVVQLDEEAFPLERQFPGELGGKRVYRELLRDWRRICTMENGKKHRINSLLIIHCPTSLGVSEVSERVNK